MDILKFKGYEGTAELDMNRGVCRGKILLINDLVTYESASPAELQKEFEAAVDDYEETCRELGRQPRIPLKGQFNVRISPRLHKALTLRAVEDGVSLNDVVTRACDAFIRQQVGPDKEQLIRGVILGVKSVGLSRAASGGPTTVRAPARRKPKKAQPGTS